MLHLPNHSMFFPELLKTFTDDTALHSLHFVTGATEFSTLPNHAWDAEGVKCGEEEAMFYGTCLAQAIRQLQSISVLSRQIVPDKILLDQSGYPRLFDFR